MPDMNWTNDETFFFIELYRNESVIWDPKHKHHKDKALVHAAWKRISDTMSIPVLDLKRKKECLLSSFRLNHKKVQASILSGAEDEDIFRPVWVFYKALAAFLGDVYECKNVLILDEKVFLDSPSVKEYSSDDDQEIISKNQEITIKEEHQIVQRPANKQCLDSLELENTQTPTHKDLSALNKSINNMKHNKKEDDCDLYGKLLAHKLRSYSALQREELMYEIDGMLLKKRRESTF